MSISRLCVAACVVLTLSACAETPGVTIDPPSSELQASKALPVAWEYFGDLGMIRHYYPRKAWDAQEDGMVYVSCGWDASGKVTGCHVLRETPQGMGFGDATIEMLRAVGRVKAKDRSRSIEPGEGLVIGIAWHNRG